MYKIPLRIQKKIVWIPMINWFCMLAWLYSSIFDRNPKRNYAKELWLFFSSSLPLGIIQLVIGNFFPIAGYILFNINGYIIPLIMGIRFIKYYEKITESNKNE